MRRRSLRRSSIIAICLVAIGCNMPSIALAQDQNPPQEKQEKPQDPPIPPAQIPGENKPDTKTPEPAPPRSALNPDISVIGNGIGRFFGAKGDADRNRPLLGELEIALQQAIYPGIRFDVFLAGHAAESLSMDLEEAYATFTRFGGLPFGGFLGQKRLNFGKLNPNHPHAWLYADVPAAMGAFLGPEGLIGNGLSANYTLPGLGDLFVNLELGAFKTVTHEEGHGEVAQTAARFRRLSLKGRQGEPAHAEHGLGIAGSFPMARLWISKPFDHEGEVDFGTSHGYGKAENGDNILVQALDFTYRRFPRSYSRWILQSEWFKHRRTDNFGQTGTHSRDGYYVHLGFRPDRYYEYGVRYDNSRFAWPLEGSESGVSFIWTNRMSESTLFRVQLKHGDRVGDSVLPAKKGYTEAWLQFVFGGGPHAPHPVQ